MSELEANSVPVEQLVEQAAAEADEEVEQVEHISVPVTIRLPSPSHARTLPQASEYRTLSFHPQPHETVQELKLNVNDWAGGYWLGPYSLRLPAKEGAEPYKSPEGAIVRRGEKLSEWLEVKDVFGGFADDEERFLDIVREPYSDLSARQSVIRLLELIAPGGTSANHLSSHHALAPGSTIFEIVRDGLATTGGEAVYEEVEVAVPSGKKGKQGKKETIKVRRELSTTENPFSDWKETDVVPLSQLPTSQPLPEVQACVRSIQASPFNPPPPQLRQLGHQFYLTVSLLEGDVHTLVCSTRGWYVSKSNVNVFDAAPRPNADGSTPAPTHSLIDLLHSLSPLFSERLSALTPLSAEPPKREPIATVPIPQHEPAYSYLATLPKPPTAPEVLRTQLAYLHSGATTVDALDTARDWNEELQNVVELPKEGVPERILREKMSQKTWSEFTAASLRAVLSISRGDNPPLNPNEESRSHMWLLSNIFITRAIDCIDTYAHVGGDAAAHVSHAKDAAGVRLLNKADITGINLLGHTVIDFQGERWVCQSVLPGIFSRKPADEEGAAEVEAENKGEETKEDWVKVGDSPVKDGANAAADVSSAPDSPELAENPLIIYGLDSEVTTKVHWDEGTHKVMEKLGNALRLAPHKITDGQGKEYEFHASAEVKALRGTDGRRYLLDLPRLMPVDVEFLQKDLESPAYPHRIVLLRPELLELFWESEFKRWARKLAAEHGPKAETAKETEGEEEKTEEGAPTGADAGAESGVIPASAVDTSSPAAEAAAARKAEQELPLDAAAIGEKIKQYDLRFNADAFVDLPPPRLDENKSAYVPSTITDESDPAVKAVRDASVFLRTIAIPALTLDVMMGNISGLMDGQSLSRIMHSRGINMRYLGQIASSITQFSSGSGGSEEPKGYLASFSRLVESEMILRASKHILRDVVRGLHPEHVPCALSHFLNCLLGTEFNAEPKAVYAPLDFSAEPEPAYVGLTPASLRASIAEQVSIRFRHSLAEDAVGRLRKTQFLRELAMRFAFQLVQRDYVFEAGVEVNGAATDSDRENKKENKKDKKDKDKKKNVVVPRTVTFMPEDVITLVPVVKSTAPSVGVAEEIIEAGRATINRGDLDLGLEIMLEGVQAYENIHSVIHPEVAAAYNTYSSTLYQLARAKMQQLGAAAAAAAASGENVDATDQPLGLDIASGVRLQKQAIIIAERTLGVYHPHTASYYFNLAMLENLEGNTQQSLRYFRHCLLLWDVIHGKNHPEINTVLSNAGVVLQAINENALSLSLLHHVQTSTEAAFGADHLSNAHALHQLTQGYFLQGDIPKALTVSVAALDIFTARLGAEHTQTKEVGKNVELLRAVVENIQRQKEMTERARQQQLERLHAAQARVAASTRRRVNSGPATGTVTKNGGTSTGAGTAAAAAAAEEDPVAGLVNGMGGLKLNGTNSVPSVPSQAEQSRIGERGHLDVDELVQFIQGSSAGGAKRSAKNALRGKRRTGAKR